MSGPPPGGAGCAGSQGGGGPPHLLEKRGEERSDITESQDYPACYIYRLEPCCMSCARLGAWLGGCLAEINARLTTGPPSLAPNTRARPAPPSLIFSGGLSQIPVVCAPATVSCREANANTDMHACGTTERRLAAG